MLGLRLKKTTSEPRPVASPAKRAKRSRGAPRAVNIRAVNRTADRQQTLSIGSTYPVTPQLSIAGVVTMSRAGPRGGAGAAQTWFDIMPLIRTRKERASPDNCAKARKLAESACRAASSEGRQRWDRLIAYLDRHEHAAREAIAERLRREETARTGEKIAVLSVNASDEDKGLIRANSRLWKSIGPDAPWISAFTRTGFAMRWSSW